MATGELPAWLNGNAALLEILESAGIRDDTALARTSYWIGMIAMGHAMVHVLMPDQAPTGQFLHFPGSRRRMPPGLPGFCPQLA